MFGKKEIPVYLFTGRILYDFMKASTTNALKSVTVNAPLLKKVYMPKYIFTVSKVTSCMVDMVLSMGALIIVMKSAVLPGISALPNRDRAGVSVLLRAWIFPCADACVFP